MYSVCGAFPGVKPERGYRVYGELFSVSDSTLGASLDRLEGYPRMYDRLQSMTSGGLAWVYVYNGDCQETDRIKSGNWLLRNKQERAA